MPTANTRILAVTNRENSEPVHGFLDFAGICARVPLSERTLREAIKRRQIPHIRLPGARRLLFDWPSVQAALARYQKGGTEE